MTKSIARRDGDERRHEVAVHALDSNSGAWGKAATLTAIVNGANEAIIGRSLDGRIVSWNPAAERIFGWSANEAIGQHISITWVEPPEEVFRFLDVLCEGGPVPPVETVRRTRDGRVIDVLFTMSPIRDENGLLVGTALIVRDITDEKRMRNELQRMHGRLEEEVVARTRHLTAVNRELTHANEELDAFAYSVSHDLRGPLRALQGFGTLVLDANRARLDTRSVHWLERIVHNATTLGRLVDALLRLSRVARHPLRREAVDASALARSVVDEAMAATDVRAAVEVQPGIHLRCDPVLLRIVFDNLVGNALKFSARRGAPQIEIGTLEKESAVAVYVKDNGAGFDPRHADKLFLPFQRLHDAGDYEGTGIGLSLVKRIVARHGGRVWADGAPDAGACFFFTLPEAAVPDACLLCERFRSATGTCPKYPAGIPATTANATPACAVSGQA